MRGLWLKVTVFVLSTGFVGRVVARPTVSSVTGIEEDVLFRLVVPMALVAAVSAFTLMNADVFSDDQSVVIGALVALLAAPTGVYARIGETVAEFQSVDPLAVVAALSRAVEAVSENSLAVLIFVSTGVVGVAAWRSRWSGYRFYLLLAVAALLLWLLVNVMSTAV
ncbi:MAG: hypothetical protein SV186_03480 [Candidatus Nanohaloarchaea archaeon]|nr:hypothetical protein [Candidatus Nanohaloarchaea archaeon]